MLFNSFEFLWFFIAVTLAFYILPHRYRWLMLLLSSCYFYMAFVPVYIVILGATIIIDYFAAFWIDRTEGKQRKVALAVSIIANVGILSFFKYYNFAVENILQVAGWMQTKPDIPYLEIILPVGLSFHTFQAMSYTIEVYFKRQQPERHFGIYALYVMFYPQLVAGPIERPQNILPQLHEKKAFIPGNVVSGLKLMAWGLFKKVIVSDRLNYIISAVYDQPNSYANWSIILAAIFFTFQLYCDFSGYSDIARGSARVMGYELMLNFNFPFYSSSVKELWTRWHISLNTWFRDYVYIPLGGNKVGKNRMYLNILFIFILSGIWHGAGWGFILFGLINAIAILLSPLIRPLWEKMLRGILPQNTIGHSIRTLFFTLSTFLILTLSFIPFRAVDFEKTRLIFSRLMDWTQPGITLKLSGYTGLYSCLLAIVFLELLQMAYYKGFYDRFFMKLPFVVRFLAYNLFLLLIMGLGVFESFPFYYFQF